MLRLRGGQNYKKALYTEKTFFWTQFIGDQYKINSSFGHRSSHNDFKGNVSGNRFVVMSARMVLRDKGAAVRRRDKEYQARQVTEMAPTKRRRIEDMPNTASSTSMAREQKEDESAKRDSLHALLAASRESRQSSDKQLGTVYSSW